MNLSPYIPSCRKVGHPSRRLAQTNLNRVIAKHDRAKRDRGPLHVFRCEACSQWHIGNSDILLSRSERRAKRKPAYDADCEVV